MYDDGIKEELLRDSAATNPATNPGMWYNAGRAVTHQPSVSKNMFKHNRIIKSGNFLTNQLPGITWSLIKTSTDTYFKFKKIQTECMSYS